jgi:hypothetical protein
LARPNRSCLTTTGCHRDWPVQQIAFPRLSDDQRRDYEYLKIEIIQDIQAGLNAFQRAGKKLIRIRDERQYREEYDTFEDFCKATLGKSKTYKTM